MKQLRTASLIVALMLLIPTVISAKTFKATGYFPSGYKSKHQAKREGGKFDRYGNLLRTLQDYSLGSYVSVASDPNYLKTGTLFITKEFPDVLFYACDVGSEVTGHHIDVCVKTEAHTFEVPKKLTILKKLGVIKNGRSNKYRPFIIHSTEEWLRLRSYFTAIKDSIQKLSWRSIYTNSVARKDVVRKYETSSRATILYASMGRVETGLQGFCHK